MKLEDFQLAIQIISSSNCAVVEFNPTNKERQTPTKNTILIKRCNAGLSKELHDAGFSLFVREDGVSVDKF